MNGIETAAIVPVGYLDRMGYQHIAKECLSSICNAFDLVVIADSVNQEFPDWLDEEKVYWLGGKKLAFGMQASGEYWFDAHLVMKNVNIALREVYGMGFSAACVLMVNNYIQNPAVFNLAMKDMVGQNAPFGWYLRLDQLANVLLGPSVMLPWIVNMRHSAGLRFAVDSLVVGTGGIQKMARGDFALADYAPVVVDVQLEMTQEDFREKQAFIRNYSDLVPKRASWGYGWDTWKKYYTDKFRVKQSCTLPLNETGKAIADKTLPEFLSCDILRELSREGSG